MWIRSFFAFSLLTLAGCQSDDSVVLNTQGKAQSQVEANEYQVQVQFRTQGGEQQSTSDALSKRIAPFEAWINQQGYQLTAGRHELRPLYHYHSDLGRQLKGYEAFQQFEVIELNFDEYQALLSQANQFKPDQVSLLGVRAGEEQKQIAKQLLIKEAFKLASVKATAMSDAAGLCQPVVSKMTEQFHASGGPRMMKMEMAASSVHQTESQEKLNLTLQVEWLAEHCH